MHEKEYSKCVIYNRNSGVYIYYMVSSWACEVTVILTQSVLLCVKISVNSQAQIATLTPSYFLL